MEEKLKDISEVLARLPKDRVHQSFSLEEFATLRRLLKEIEKNSAVVTRISPEGEKLVTREIPNNVLEVLIGEMVKISRVNPDRSGTFKERLERALEILL